MQLPCGADLGLGFCQPSNGWPAYGVTLQLTATDACGDLVQLVRFMDVGEWRKMVAMVEAQAPWEAGGLDTDTLAKRED